MARQRDVETIFMDILKDFVLTPQKSPCHKTLDFQDSSVTEIPGKNEDIMHWHVINSLSPKLSVSPERLLSSVF